MKIGKVIKPNKKGQITIPAKIRKALGIDETTNINVVKENKRVYLEPLMNTIAKNKQKISKNEYLEVLSKTKGAWGKESNKEKKERLKRRKKELEKAKESKKQW